MSWPPIIWGDFSWEAFATLATGFAAVSGATWLGSRQLKISEQQSKILQAQTGLSAITAKQDLDLRKQEFRVSLFEKRYAILEEFRPVWFDWSAHNTLTTENWATLYHLTLRARVLFSGSLKDDLDLAVGVIEKQLQYSRRATDDDHRDFHSEAQQEKGRIPLAYVERNVYIMRHDEAPHHPRVLQAVSG